MGARTGTALRALKFFLRAVQFACAAIILSLFSYFLATLANHNLPTASWIRAVEAISGSAVLYVVLSVVAAIWFASATVRPLSALVSLTLDAGFGIAFIYVAAANKGGSGSCTGYVETPFGNGDADTGVVTGTGGWTALPSLRQACQMQTACLAVAVVGLFFFLFSLLTELALIRHRRREGRYDPSPANDLGESSGKPDGPVDPNDNNTNTKKRGFFASLFGRKKRPDDSNTAAGYNPNALPQHAHPDDVRPSYTTEQTRVGTGYNSAQQQYDDDDLTGLKYHQDSSNNASGYGPVGGGGGYGNANHGSGGYVHVNGNGNGNGGYNEYDDVPLAQYPPANYRYSDGVYERV